MSVYLYEGLDDLRNAFKEIIDNLNFEQSDRYNIRLLGGIDCRTLKIEKLHLSAHERYGNNSIWEVDDIVSVYYTVIFDTVLNEFQLTAVFRNDLLAYTVEQKVYYIKNVTEGTLKKDLENLNKCESQYVQKMRKLQYS